MQIMTNEVVDCALQSALTGHYDSIFFKKKVLDSLLNYSNVYFSIDEWHPYDPKYSSCNENEVTMLGLCVQLADSFLSK